MADQPVNRGRSGLDFQVACGAVGDRGPVQDPAVVFLVREVDDVRGHHVRSDEASLPQAGERTVVSTPSDRVDLQGALGHVDKHPAAQVLSP